jgi:hypothetical protein
VRSTEGRRKYIGNERLLRQACHVCNLLFLAITWHILWSNKLIPTGC